MTGATASVHWSAILTVVGLGLGMVAGAVWRLGSIIMHWRDENAQAVGELAGLVGDWCDEVDDHLLDQDQALLKNSSRMGRLEDAAGLPPSPPYVPPKGRRTPRRLDAVRMGLRASHRPEGQSASDTR